ncbi:MAG TPA: sugar ABC transporter permease [Chloroflexota bacterium]|nr:sugar ABC transporter permease [Chloroflexota bacterium]
MSVRENTRPIATSGRRQTLRRRETVAGYLFLLPNIVGFLIFSSLPVLATLAISTLHWDLIRAPTFVGLQNYRQMLFADPTFWTVLRNTTYYVVGTVPAGVILSLLLALAMNANIRGIAFFRALFFIPVISSSVAVAVMWQWLYNTDYGLINYGLSFLGIHAVPWLTSTGWAMPAVIIMAIWKHLGYDMIIYLAGLQGIPTTLYEAAAIDGANRWSKFWFITVPLLTPTTFFILVISIINSFQVFDLAFILTRGGPGDATNTVVMYIYNQAFQFFQMGYAAAVAWVLFLIIMAITLIQWRGQKNWVQYE